MPSPTTRSTLMHAFTPAGAGRRARRTLLAAAVTAGALATSASEPFVSARIDLETAVKAKSTYPRYAISHTSP